MENERRLFLRISNHAELVEECLNLDKMLEAERKMTKELQNRLKQAEDRAPDNNRRKESEGRCPT